ncbi:hypothetical protein QEN19_004359 [Hanseniaspora menglaensis]
MENNTEISSDQPLSSAAAGFNKRYQGITCDHCKRNNLFCTFFAPERKRGNKKFDVLVKNKETIKNSMQSKDLNSKTRNKYNELTSDNSVRKKQKRTSKTDLLLTGELSEDSKSKKLSDSVTNSDDEDLSMEMKLQKYDTLFKCFFNTESNLDSSLNIKNINVDLFSKIYNNINKGDVTTDNYNFDGSNNNILNNNYFQKSVDKYKYIISSKIPADLNVFTLQVPLPTKETAVRLIEKAWMESFVVFRFYHRPSFIKNLQSVYSMAPHEYDEKLIKFLPALYSVMAVGSLFSQKNKKTEKDKVTKTTEEYDDEEGYRYFLAARNMIDLSNSSDLHSIQTIVMLFMFLQCSARLSTCYIFIGIAMRSALREGYHRYIPTGSPGYTLLDIEMRKRTFFTIYKMDIYVNNMLGLPKAISSNDFDQQLPLEYEDEFITDEGLMLPTDYDPKRNITSVCISNHHTKLIMLLEEVVDKLYPCKKTNNVIPHRTVTELEVKLDNWTKQLPKYLMPGLKEDQLPNEFLYKANRLLHFSFLQVQIVLYRPFIHYLIFNDEKHKGTNPTDELALKRGEMCKKVAKQTILLAKEMMERNYLNGNHWFSIYTIFFSVAGLIFYVHEATPDQNNPEEMKEYIECSELCKVAKKILDFLKGSSKAANRTYNVLNTLFDSLNKRTKMFMEMNFNKKTQQERGNTPSNGIFNRQDFEFNTSGDKNLQKGSITTDTPIGDFMSLFSLNNGSCDASNFNEMLTYMAPPLTEDGYNYNRNINTPASNVYSSLIATDSLESKIPSTWSNSSNSGQKPYPIATVSGSNLPLPVIDESINDLRFEKLQEADNESSPAMNSFTSQSEKHNILLDINQESMFNNPAFDKNLSPVNIISDENVLPALNSVNSNWLFKEGYKNTGSTVEENKSVPLMMNNITEKNTQTKNNESLYLSGVFDQLDMQLFGRYLPPYMTRTQKSTFLTDSAAKNSEKPASPS